MKKKLITLLSFLPITIGGTMIAVLNTKTDNKIINKEIKNNAESINFPPEWRTKLPSSISPDDGRFRQYMQDFFQMIQIKVNLQIHKFVNFIFLQMI